MRASMQFLALNPKPYRTVNLLVLKCIRNIEYVQIALSSYTYNYS